MKTNKTFYAAVDWVQTNGFDFWKQFDVTTWAAANKYVDLIDPYRNGETMTKKQALAYIRSHY